VGVDGLVRRVHLVGQVGFLSLVGSLTIGGCSQPPAASPPPTAVNRSAADVEHQGITTPHGDHSPHHGGMVLMNGELHYEVVFDHQGRHRIWFSDAVREELPASVARDVRMTVARPGTEPENLALEIDEAGESWVASGKPVSGDNVMVKVTFVAQGSPHEIEIPFLIPVE
jgi:hypothetical protein